MAEPTQDRDEMRHAPPHADSPANPPANRLDDDLLGEHEAIVEGRPADLPAVLTREVPGG